MKRVVPTLAAGLALVALPVFAQDSGPVVQQGAEVVGEELVPERGDVAARDLPIARAWRPGDPVKDIPRRRYPRPGGFKPEAPVPGDPLLELQASAPAATASVDPLLDLAGQGFTGVNPPDTVGDVGGAWYVQSINGSGGALVTIHDKVTGAVVAGPFAMEGLAAGGNCASGLGDPIVLYDRAADRWLLSEFSSSGNNLCIYISTGSDPTGTYCRYTVTAPGFPDYPKYAVWPDAYYVTTNESSPAIYALDRVNMAACGTARAAQRFTVADLAGFGFQALTPADLDGVDDPPPGSPGIVMRHRDTEPHGPAGLGTIDRLELWEVGIDWTTPAASTLTALPSIDVAEFDSTLCGLTSFFCMAMPGVAQGSSSSLDPLREVVMHRLAYRRLGGDQVLVGNLVTDVGADQGGVRWFELRNTGSLWGLYQEGTYAPDAVNRWMGAIAMDGAGNILLGYNASNGTVHPSLRYTGREAADPPGTMPVAETVLVAGTATNGSNRYGDYAAMSVDPEDDCTFWFTGEYNAGTTWATRIGSMKFSSCGTPGFTLGATPAARTICAGSNADFAHTVGSVAGFDEPVTLGASGLPAGASAGFVPNPVPTLPGAATLTIADTGTVAAGPYTITVTGTSAPSGFVRTKDVTLTVFDASPSAPALTSPADGALNVARRPTFSWAAASQAESYLLEVDNDPGFGSPVYTQTVAGTSHQPASDLPTNTQLYWRVRASNTCGDGGYSSTFGFVTEAAAGDCSIGSAANVTFQYGFEAGAAGWTSSGTGNTWAESGVKFHSGAKSWKAADPATVSDQRLVSPAIAVPAGTGNTLQFWSFKDIENNSTTGCYDGAILETSTDNVNFTQVTTFAADPYRGPVSGSFSNPLADLDAWCEATASAAWVKTVASLDALAGQSVYLRFRLGSDTIVGREGWYLDDVLIQNCVAGGLFADGFEPGDFSRWSLTGD